MLKVKSNHNFANSITCGKEYEVLKSDESQYLIEDDEGYQLGFLKKYFDVVQSKQLNLIDEFIDKMAIMEVEFSEEYCLKISEKYANKFKELIINAVEFGRVNPLKSGEQFYHENYK